MAKSTSLNFTQQVNLGSTVIALADTTTLKTVYTAPAEDAIVKAISIASTDTAERNVALYLNDGATDLLLGTIAVPANSGNTGAIASVDGLTGSLLPGLPYDANGKRILPMKNGHILKAGVLVSVTAAKAVTVLAVAEEY